MDKRYRKRILIIEIEQPEEQKLDKEINWVCYSLGLADKGDRLATSIFRELVLAAKNRGGISSREITDKEGVTQGAVVYHLNNFIRSGVVVRRGRTYYLRAPTLDRTLEEIEHDMIRRVRMIRKMARLIDDNL